MSEPLSLKARAALKRRFRHRSRVFGGWTSFGRPSIAETFCHAGMDFVGIDLEHTSISLRESESIIVATQSLGKVSLPRVSSHNGEQIKRQLDAGADGVIVPMVNTPEELDRIVNWTKYPTVGKRSFGVARAQGYGFDFSIYMRTWNDSSILILQIESIEGVSNIDRLVNHEEVDGVMIGPYDMSGSLGIPGQLDHPRVTEACAEVIKACKTYGKSCGTQIVDPDVKNVAQAFKRGFTFVILGSDLFQAWTWGERMQNLIKTQRKESK